MNACTLTRKQREFQQREELILQTASQLIQTHGYLGLTMDKIAEAIQYSKGTVYQHFTCKEEVLATLCLRAHQDLYQLFERVVRYPAPSRVRIHGIMLAYMLHIFSYPFEFQNIQLIRSRSLMEKLTPEKQAAMAKMEVSIIRLIASVAQDAISEGNLVLDKRIRVEELLFAFWSMAYGGILLLSGEFPFSEMNVRPLSVLHDNFLVYLDGLRWQPLSLDYSYAQSNRELLDKLFYSEYHNLNLEQQQRIMAFVG